METQKPNYLLNHTADKMYIQNRNSSLHLFTHLTIKYLLRQYHVPITIADYASLQGLFLTDITSIPGSL